MLRKIGSFVGVSWTDGEFGSFGSWEFREFGSWELGVSGVGSWELGVWELGVSWTDGTLTLWKQMSAKVRI
jgi:hypothetical protein